MGLGIPGDLLVQVSVGATLLVVLVALVVGRLLYRRRAAARSAVRTASPRRPELAPGGPDAHPVTSDGPSPNGHEPDPHGPDGAHLDRTTDVLAARIPAPRAPAGDAGSAAGGAGEIRDRLLSVLLDDPGGAVGAATELEACRRRLDHLSDAIRRESDMLAGALYRLTEAGLRPDQISRLAALPIDEVRELLERATARR